MLKATEQFDERLHCLNMLSHLLNLKLTCLLLLGSALAQVDPYSREADPVILKGEVLPNMLGQDPAMILAYAWTGTEFEQIPVQIDEMHVQLWDVIKNGDCFTLGRNDTHLVYADANTYSGPDEDTTFDSDDELVFMARHLGVQYDGSDLESDIPEGVSADPYEELDIWDPLTGASAGFAYLFTGDLDQSAGQQLVTYDFTLTKTGSGGTNEYLDAYETDCTENPNLRYECHDEYPKNPEDTWFTSDYYERHWSQNWYSDDLKIFAGDATGEDILSIQDFQFTLESCIHCAKSFMDGRTAFIANIAGPVRAIRSWVGANSGCITQREHHLYERRDDQVSYLRVHPIPGVMEYVVHEAGVPLTYYNCNHMEGIPVDGVPDADTATEDQMCNWEFVTGDAGTMVRVVELVHDLHHHPEYDPDIWFNQWYYDNETPDDPTGGSDDSPIYNIEPRPWHMCGTVTSGQQEAWGTHGYKFDFVESQDLLILNTDPLRWGETHHRGELPPEACPIEVRQPQVFTFEFHINHYYEEPNMPVEKGEQYYEVSYNHLYRN